MGFKFAQSTIELEHNGRKYDLLVNTRLAVDLEVYMNMHPLTLWQRISASTEKNEIPPMGQMATFFEFMLKKAGCNDVDFDKLYNSMFDGQDAVAVSSQIGQLLSLFAPQQDEEPEASPKKTVARKAKK